MKLLYLGDVMGRAGRRAIAERLPALKERLKVDFAVVNGENATSGAGITPDHAKGLLDAGADVVTLGDHAFDRREMMSGITAEPRILRPINFSKAAFNIKRLLTGCDGPRGSIGPTLVVLARRPVGLRDNAEKEGQYFL